MLCNSRSRYVEHNDNNDDISYSSKFLWSGMFVIEVINHVIVVVLRYRFNAMLHSQLMHTRVLGEAHTCARGNTHVCEGKYSCVRGKALTCVRGITHCVSRNTRVPSAFRVYDDS